MRNGTCDKCGGAVRQLTAGIEYGTDQGPFLYIKGGAQRPSSYETFACTSCGYFENYVTDVEKLRAMEAGEGGWASPSGS